MSDTIFAPATASGRGAVAVVRVSGPGAADALQSIAGPLPPPRYASLRRLRGAGGELIDEALVLWMPGPGSFTGEDSVELQVHGGPAVVAAVSDHLAAVGLRLAEPGEFTRRAFQNGRLDLAQAEAVADLVDAETGPQRRQALAQLGGALTQRYEAWRERLLDALSHLEAEVDFPDEDALEEGAPVADPVIAAVVAEMAAATGDLRGERVREGFRVALIGAPNVGKSSLLNALIGRDAAIVTDIAGTTRDVVEAPLVMGGQAIILADTAGLRETVNTIEAEGVRRARAWAETADLRIGIMDITRGETMREAVEGLRAGDILALNKRDLAIAHEPSRDDLDVVETSATEVGGTEALRRVLTSRVGQAASGEFPAVTRARHRTLLQEAVGHLARSGVQRLPAELAAEDIRLALRSLERVTGRVNPEAVLDRVFATFCMGK